ncbi:phosphatidylethanolamine-binding protein [Clohesyomyces aquaticus]|uniref:Phosphatidylethanolamine-binding protein n=1 Tax=Clohesyomyces aquaticus TaxID=1231657 RepID=A0A1Y1ZGC3_9PLEO|nr:phosphatidylethanolamine-binding protein [Clohesyomyces aquaticus]
MLFYTIASMLVAGTALAQTPPGFVPQVNKTLDVYYGTTYITPGLMVKKSSVSKAPTIGVTGVTLTGAKYLMVMIGKPPQGTATKRGTVLHALLQDYIPTTQTLNGSLVLTTKATGPASYFGPAPPAETPKHPHNYLFLLHEQPANFAVPQSQKSVVSGRMNIDWIKFMKDAGLTDPLYANYLQVQSGDNTRRG